MAGRLVFSASNGNRKYEKRAPLSFKIEEKFRRQQQRGTFGDRSDLNNLYERRR